MFCRRCGAEVNPQVAFCRRCGKEVAGSGVEASAEPVAEREIAAAEEAVRVPSTITPEPESVRLASPVAEELAEEGPTPLSLLSQMETSERSPRHWLLAGAALLLIAAAGIVFVYYRYPTFFASVSDDNIVKSIKSKFSVDPNLSKCTIQEKSERGVVTLTGLVNNNSDRSLARTIALQSRGVKSVVDNLVLPSPPPPKETPEPITGKIVEENSAPPPLPEVESKGNSGELSDTSVRKSERVPNGPAITSVSPIYPTGTQTIIIRGSGFGQHDPYNGCTNFLFVEDIANHQQIGWAPDGASGCPWGQFPIYVKRWTNDEIVIGGFPASSFRVGDVLLIKIANTQGKGIINADPNLHGGPVAKCSVTVIDSN